MEVLYTATPEDSYVDAAITASLQIHCDEPGGGDILIFLTGQASWVPGAFRPGGCLSNAF